MPSSPARSLVQFTCDDGHVLHGTLWTPAEAPAAVVLIHPATAVPESLYAPFAEYLASRGLAAVTYDYRGIGRSAPATLRGFSARMRDWADLDVETVTTWARERFAGVPLLAVGHSFGGHAIGLGEGSRHLKAAVFIASHAGYLGVIRGRLERWRATFLLRALGPLLCHTLGYMPGRALGLGENLPAGVFLEWGQWASLPRYFFDDASLLAEARFARRRLPVLAVGFDDDPWATPPGIDLLVGKLVNCDVQRRQINPAAAGAPVGHMGFFRRRHREALWPGIADWLLATGGVPQPEVRSRPEARPA
ncbi:alpha/beta fold hydrolase [Rhizobacter sp. Root1221]|uniref:alpha/beta hydrolase family protein n=1 Tax=Rhizobacter sp. Root1221 TaxID=1736433 RepID=UPI0009E8E64D|nr:alpha/beta fold hydrolase [Rhizobacter sp. Root1221]